MAIRQPRPAPVEELSWRSRHHGKRMSEAGFLALPEEKPYLELIDGVVLQKTMGDHIHGRLAGIITMEFGNYVGVHGGDFGPEGRVRLPAGHYQVPDVAVWADGVYSGNDSLPTIAVEIRSPDESMASQRAKCRRYREAGVPVAWLIDPISRTVEVFDAGQDAEPLAPDGALETEHLPGFRLPLTELFAALDR